MDDTQRKAAAAGFLHILSISQEVREKFQHLAGNSDSAGMRDLIKRSCGLAEAPSEDDVAAMAQHADGHLAPQVTAVQQADMTASKRSANFLFVAKAT